MLPDDAMQRPVGRLRVHNVAGDLQFLLKWTEHNDFQRFGLDYSCA